MHVGIGQPPGPRDSYDVSEYVLGAISVSEMDVLAKLTFPLVEKEVFGRLCLTLELEDLEEKVKEG